MQNKNSSESSKKLKITNESIPEERKSKNRNCPFMDTINRKNLDFDFEKVCSISLERHNVYVCLVCGVFFKGRSKSSPAYFHSISEDHHVFMRLDDEKTFCLPEGYEVEDHSLDDIKNAFNPKYSKEQIDEVVEKEKYCSSLSGTTFIAGRLGINNLGHTDYFNSVLQILLAVPPLVKFFLNHSNYETSKSPFVQRFGELTRKFFNPHSFKGQISPQELLQEMERSSNDHFKIGRPVDVIDALVWVLNRLHSALKSTDNKSIISDSFQGLLMRTSIGELKRKKRPFFYLSLDLPPTPLYHGDEDEKFIPQVPINELLKKFNGETVVVDRKGKATYSLLKFPPFLIIHIKRFIKNEFRAEKNPTIINFPVKDLETKELRTKWDLKKLKSLGAVKLRNLWNQISDKEKVKEGEKTKEEIISLIKGKENDSVRYNLIGNVVHNGESVKKGKTKAFVLHTANKKWYETQDLTIEESMAQLVTVAESYVQIWQRVN